MAASRTADGRTPHSAHVYYLRAGDARKPVDFHVERARDGGTLSTRRVTARQDGEVLLEALASFSTPVADTDHQIAMPDVPDPDSLLPVEEQLRDYADEFGGHWVRSQPFELRYVDPPPRLAVDLPERSPRMRMWWRPTEPVPDDAVLHSCLLTYLSGTTMLETAIAMRACHPDRHVLGADRPRTLVPPSHRRSTTGCCRIRCRPVGSMGGDWRPPPCTTAPASWCALRRRSCTSAPNARGDAHRVDFVT